MSTHFSRSPFNSKPSLNPRSWHAADKRFFSMSTPSTEVGPAPSNPSNATAAPPPAEAAVAASATFTGDSRAPPASEYESSSCFLVDWRRVVSCGKKIKFEVQVEVWTQGVVRGCGFLWVNGGSVRHRRRRGEVMSDVSHVPIDSLPVAGMLHGEAAVVWRWPFTVGTSRWLRAFQRERGGRD